ncbi:Uncharacterized conserved protein, DUF302 family [Modicisalibacter muralis]|uniref:Uncharacterized conserved protein, DUF302 family n=1 Tax=Modicisalibacter muralis TaxID=119000 RepID=A0A1G9I261_9GAMM|nr:DUF302 domain-containing protein [Halomonas muralis]SDL19004.1 Uncharacterized conserved protein, DUF302 family [Halomonas muralis]
MALRAVVAVIVLVCLFSATAQAEPQADKNKTVYPGIRHITTEESVNEVEALLRQALHKRGLTLFTVIDHAQGAVDAGLELPPTRTVIFGNPKVGTPMMRCQGSVALDLPQKMVIRMVDDVTRIEWNDPAYLVERHGLQGCNLSPDKVARLVSELAREAAGEER